MGKDYDTQAELLEATSELTSAIQKYHRAVNRAEGKPTLDSYPVDKFMFIAFAELQTGTLYHMGHSVGLSPHELVGLAELLKDRVS
jgi:hypothetical protein